MRLNNKVALVTGGNSGIGLATAKVFLSEGAKVVITGRNPETLAAAEKALGGNVLAVNVDVTDIAATEKAFAEAAEKVGKFDIVFANAGIGGVTPLGQTTFEQFNRIISTNLTAVFFTVQSALPHLNEGASVILNGSVHAVLGAPGWSAYAATKAGVRAMTRNLASELAPRGIRVNQVTPGGTKTPIWSPFAQTDDAMSALEEKLGGMSALGRMSEAEEIGKAALYLASDDAANITGIEITVDGGMTSAPSGAKIFRTAAA
ncbi:NAD(P)-dependent dehydrogenase (short-subunit alcohol dehydrogenase family) [Neorhizobium sp. 2083]|uniref:SDR family NAD(P)-dependent oxidoreductase n=1 Tax=Neorhizobium sp. 2083 TaxID=2817762 RepID=UPI002860C343|nr:SDR family oxidoreductase [Neorhizobium sp. 2083]MDR6819633.1 NAD(P)-dependent dehydrogenase (short-subunit alcohol dehydrogenase family) [Neorhizobium sp. 2083]